MIYNRKEILERADKRKAERKPVAKTVRQPINRESVKMKATKKDLKKEYPKFLKSHPFCELKISPECTKIATVIHHVRGRIGEQVHRQEDWMASCPACNSHVENKDAEAREKGLKKSKFNAGKKS